MRRALAAAGAALCVVAGARAQTPDAPARALMEQAAAVLPSPRQLAWQDLEFTCFIHFGVNTFTGREWGTGLEDPAIFNPTDFDADQWARVAKDAGMRLILLTAKHHDGFCLFPSDYTEHDVAASPWRDGAGDVVREVADACRRHGLKFGFYLSPADLAEIERPGGRYGNGSEARPSVIPSPVESAAPPAETFEYTVDDYNRYFLNQLWELLTRYGPVHEVWFDGANPKPGTGQTYAYDAWYDLIRRLAPEAVIAIKGPDVRWCGNEAGRTRASEWSVIPIGASPDEWQWPDMTAPDLGSLDRLRETIDGGGFLHWYPAEVNTSIRHGWFWRDEQQHVKSAGEILDVWERSVGGNTVFLLNVPPDRRGRFADRDVQALQRVGRRIERTYGVDLATGARAWASAVRGAGFGAGAVIDGDPAACWAPPDWSGPQSLEVRLPEPRQISRVSFREAIATFGQRIERFAIDIWTEDGWVEVAAGTTVGARRICRFEPVTTDRVRLRILEARVCPTISELTLHDDPG
ncbi:MAG: alpha-L-fucosidase [Phycisphaerales bacterium JB039]